MKISFGMAVYHVARHPVQVATGGLALDMQYAN
jgi:hypothetical protein